MATETNLNVAPYFDDFDESKNFHRVLFKAATAIQTRELNQLQTIFQNQIERFGNHVFRDGTIVEGCPVSFYNELHFVRMADHVANGNLLDVSQLVGSLAVSTTTGLKGTVMTVKAGTEANYPNTNRVYVSYLNTGSGQTKVFQPNEELIFYSPPQSANNRLEVGNTFLNTAPNTFTSYVGQGISVETGLIYQKGFFIRVNSQTAVVSDTAYAGNVMVGFTTNEVIVNSDIDESLLDNALGYTNENAPGADRLKLVANLEVVTTEDLADAEAFTPIVEYIDNAPVMKNTDPQYARLGDMLAQSKYEESGSYVVKPFTVDTTFHPTNSQLLVARVSPGSGYAQGHRVELVKTANINVRRGTSVDVSEAQLITTNYGQYVLVDDYAGTLDFTNNEEVLIYSAAQNALTGRTGSTLSPSGSVIGVANIRAIRHNAGTPGTPSCQYAVYLYNIRMSSGWSFTLHAKSLYSNGAVKGVADLVLDGSSQAVIYNAERRGMVWSFGKKAIKTLKDGANNVDTQYIFRQKTTSTMAANGVVAITLGTAHAGGSNKFPYGVGVLGDGNEDDFIIIMNTAAQTGSLTGTVAVTSGAATVTGSSTAFTSQYSVGEYILVNSEVRRITAISSATSMTVDANWAGSASANVHVKYFPAGYTVPIIDSMVGVRDVNINSDTSATIRCGLSAAASLTGAVAVTIYHNVLRYDTVPAKKQINKNMVVKINTANNAAGATGPWCMGVPDVHRIRAVYTGNSIVGSDISQNFYFDTGMTDTHYDHAYLYVRPGATSFVPTDFTVVYDSFVSNTTPGVGFFSVDSYPIDDANTANTNAIQTKDIPTYVSESGARYPLRDCIDFRPYKIATAVYAPNTSHSTVNPVVTNTFIIDSLGTYVPTPDANFQADVQFYLGRKDLLYFSNRGFIKVKQGVASENPITPTAPEDGMGVSVINIKPYPSLTSSEQSSITVANRQAKSLIRDTSFSTTVSLVTNRRYTMKDIGVLDSRIARMEYYMTLSLLEKAATDMNVPDANGLNRFKNGIFVDPFTSHINGEVSNPEYKISIDTAQGIARPYFKQDGVDLEFVSANSSGVQQTSRLLTLPYTEVVYTSQPFATKFRQAAAMQFHWSGHVQLYPTYDHYVDTVNEAAVNITMDLASPWQEFANSPFGTTWGDWRTTGVSSVTDSSTVNSVVVDGRATATTATTTNTTTTTSSQVRDGATLGINLTSSTYNLGNYVEDVAIQPFLRSREIAFHGWGIRPGTIIHCFFDDVNVDGYCAPGVRNGAIVSTDDDRYVTRTGAWGASIASDANGVVFGKFVIPEGQFRVGERQFRIADVTDLVTGSDAVSTGAVTTYVGSGLQARTRARTLTTVQPELQISGISDVRSTSTSSTSTNVSTHVHVEPEPPVAPQIITNTIIQQIEVQVPVIERVVETVIVPGPPPEIIHPNAFFEQTGAGDGSGDGGDPISQGFTVNIPANVSGMFVTSIDVYFQKKPIDSNIGVTLYITEIMNGYPDGTRVLPFSKTYKTNAQVNISSNGTVPTTFTLEAPVYVANDRKYAYVVFPDGGNPDYLVWAAELGSTDVVTGFQVSSKPSVDTIFVSANQQTWTAIQNEYMKFTLRRAHFQYAYGQAFFRNKDNEYLQMTSYTSANNTTSLRAGDLCYVAGNTTHTSSIGYSGYGQVEFFNPLNNELKLRTTVGTFANNAIVQFHRPLDGVVTSISDATRISTATVTQRHVQLNAVVPRFAVIEPPGTQLVFNTRTTSPSYVLDSFYTPTPMETETEFFDYERRVYGRTREITNMSGGKSLLFACNMATTSMYLSPVIDTIRSTSLCIGNLIDPTSKDLSNEYYNYGDVQTKYISNSVTLDDGQDAEDFQLYITGYRPPSSDIIVYAKFLNAEDSEAMSQKNWTRLTSDSTAIFSDYRNVRDFREMKFTVPTVAPVGIPAGCAYIDGSNGLKYTSNGGQIFYGYKSFQLKFILLSDTTARVPRVDDIRALALQL